MKKFICSLAALAMLCTAARADEGMWMLPLLKKMNIGTMKKMGCKLSAEDIYSINHSSLKDAIVQFGGGCTGEVISDEGLVVTNHHCGYSSIQQLSTPQHNYLEDGYWAMNRSEELPVPGLSVKFLVGMGDVTNVLETLYSNVEKAFADSAEVWRAVQRAQIRRNLCNDAEKDFPGAEAEIVSFYNDNVHYLVIYKTYRDVRFVGAPPASVGKFGGETDNWMWPRHTCDFSMFRIYADKDGNPAEYSADNRPYRSARSLTISLKGVKEGDFSFIMGYPGRTQRFQTAAELENMIDICDIRVGARTERQAVMLEGMESSPVIRLQYADKYAGSANGWKKWQGEILAFEKLGIIPREKEREAELKRWIDSDPVRRDKYGDPVAEIAAYEDEVREDRELIYMISETVGDTGLFDVYATLMKNGADSASFEAAKAAAKGLFKDMDMELEKKLTARMLEYYRESVDSSLYLPVPANFATADFPAWVDSLFETSCFASPDRIDTLSGPSQIANDPFCAYVEGVRSVLAPGIGRIAMLDKSRARKLFAEALLEFSGDGPSYPDANFTMRLTYGKVGGYSPADGVWYDHVTTLDGVMEKENPDDYEFMVPERLKELWQAKDYGRYADKNGTLPACFLTNNDITGGNSGSPVLNARGQLIGLAFDGNWESMSSDVMFEPDLQRCICVDIRYVLFMLDKFGGASWLLDEMKIVK